VIASIFSFSCAADLLLTIERLCHQFRTLSLSGRPWSNDTVRFFAQSGDLDFQALQFFSSGRLRYVTELVAMSPYRDLAWLQPRALPRLRLLALASLQNSAPVFLADRGLQPLLRLTSLEVA
jgi:hypothetical protein